MDTYRAEYLYGDQVAAALATDDLEEVKRWALDQICTVMCQVWLSKNGKPYRVLAHQDGVLQWMIDPACNELQEVKS